MQIISTYSVKIKHYNSIFTDTVLVYRKAVDFLLDAVLSEWEIVSTLASSKEKMMFVESLTHHSKTHPFPKYDFDKHFYKMPSYIRRAAIADAIGRVSSFKSNYKNWEKSQHGRAPRLTSCGFAYPTLYRENAFNLTGEYTAEIKVFRNNTWEWLSVELKKSDMDYIRRKCKACQYQPHYHAERICCHPCDRYAAVRTDR